MSSVWVLLGGALLMVLVVILIAWFGPRPRQWQSHEGPPEGESDPPLT